MVDVILGLQWGDEGKGKIVDFFAPNYDIIARFQGGPNAGHTLYIEGKKVVLHQIPSGIFQDNCINIIGGGVVLDPVVFKKECETVSAHGIEVQKKLILSERTNLILPTHRAIDKASEIAKGKEKIGSTQKGIGPAYMDKTGRNALRVGDILNKNFTTEYIKLRLKHQKILDSLNFNEDISAWEEEFFEAIEYLKTFKIISSEYFLNNALSEGKKILAEGAQGSMLDVDFGTFPFVTSSNTVSAGVCTGLGISPKKINEIYGISKAYCTRVGSGPFPTELFDETGENIRKWGNEFGSTTGRPRRCGWIDLVALKYACMINGVTQIIMTKIDILDNLLQVKACTGYGGLNNEQEIPFKINTESINPKYSTFDGWATPISSISDKANLPENLIKYIKFVDDFLNVPTKYLSNGPNREQLIFM